MPAYSGGLAARLGCRLSITRGGDRLSIEWIARNALPLWTLLLVAAVIVGDLGWQRAAHRRQSNVAAGRRHSWLPPRPALVAVLALLLVFAALAALVMRGDDRLVGLDVALAAQLKTDLSPQTLAFVDTLTQLGHPAALALLTVLVAALLLVLRRYGLAATWLVSVVGTALINSALKLLFQRARPPHTSGLVAENGFSFPSGHASGAMVFYGMLAYVLLQVLPPRWHRVVVAGTVVAISIIGVSRILLQVHYLSDVLAGYASGLAWLLLCIGAAEYRASRRDPG